MSREHSIFIVVKILLSIWSHVAFILDSSGNCISWVQISFQYIKNLKSNYICFSMSAIKKNLKTTRQNFLNYFSFSNFFNIGTFIFLLSLQTCLVTRKYWFVKKSTNKIWMLRRVLIFQNIRFKCFTRTLVSLFLDWIPLKKEWFLQ